MSAALPNKDDAPKKKENRFKTLGAERRQVSAFNSKYSKAQLDCMHKLHTDELKLKELKYLDAPSSIIKRQTSIVQEREDKLGDLQLTLQDYYAYCKANFVLLSEPEFDTYLRGRCRRWTDHIKEFMKKSKEGDANDLFNTAPCRKMVSCCGPLCKLHMKLEEINPKKKS